MLVIDFDYYKALPSHYGFIRTFVLNWPSYDKYVYAFLRMYPVLCTIIYDVPCFLGYTDDEIQRGFIYTIFI